MARARSSALEGIPKAIRQRTKESARADRATRSRSQKANGHVALGARDIEHNNAVALKEYIECIPSALRRYCAQCPLRQVQRDRSLSGFLSELLDPLVPIL